MNSFLFDKWVIELDKKFKKEHRKVVLIVDNYPAHPIIKGSKSTELMFLPPNTTSQTQPMDQGVISSLKAKVSQKRKFIQSLIKAVDIQKHQF